jgi:hypothetical protein
MIFEQSQLGIDVRPDSLPAENKKTYVSSSAVEQAYQLNKNTPIAATSRPTSPAMSSRGLLDSVMIPMCSHGVEIDWTQGIAV